MIRIYTVAEAEQSILRRENVLDPAVPETMRVALRRVFGEDLSPATAVARILADVRHRGDAALRSWTRQIDGIAPAGLAVSQDEMEAAMAAIPVELAQALRVAAERIRAFHGRQPLASWSTSELGGRLGQRVTPLRRVGVYVPGGTAPLPSSLLMSAIPAQVAGVPDIIVTTPPGRGSGRVPDIILAAAHVAGIERLYQVGGAQAIAAMAFGTETIARVDKIVGPGNLFVTLAKKQLYGIVGIDGLYGPTETVVIADDTAAAGWVAADLLAQAEHDVLATAILLTPSRALAEAVQVEVARQVEQLSRAEVIATALAGRGGIVLTTDLDEATRLANAFAPEHLCIATANAAEVAGKIHSAGGIFIGERSFEVLGDYVAGPSHVMPTGGTARFASPLSAVDFVRITSIVELDDATSTRLSQAAALLAEAEGLDAHARAARQRLKIED